MITKRDLGPLNEYKSAAGRVLSVYLDVDQSNAANLNRGVTPHADPGLQHQITPGLNETGRGELKPHE